MSTFYLKLNPNMYRFIDVDTVVLKHSFLIKTILSLQINHVHFSSLIVESCS